jgi:hypothetical protein
MSEHKQRAVKAKATLEAKAKEYARQAIKINPEWSVVRIDDLNWQIKQKGRKEPWDRWYYGSVKGALLGVFQKALNEQPQNFLLAGNLITLATRIEACLDQLSDQKPRGGAHRTF